MNKSETTLTKKDFEKVCLQKLNLNLKPDQPQEASTRYQIAIAYLMHQLQSQEKRSLFLLTLTYQIRSDFAPKQDLMNRNFKRFYCSFFLPFLFETKHYNTNKRILQQPITYSFLEEHKRKPHTTHGAAPLHHHAIVAATESTLPRIALLLGTDTFKDIDPNFFIATSDFKRCDLFGTLYASKSIKKYPDFLTFPKRLQSVLDRTPKFELEPELPTDLLLDEKPNLP